MARNTKRHRTSTGYLTERDLLVWVSELQAKGRMSLYYGDYWSNIALSESLACDIDTMRQSMIYGPRTSPHGSCKAEGQCMIMEYEMQLSFGSRAKSIDKYESQLSSQHDSWRKMLVASGQVQHVHVSLYTKGWEKLLRKESFSSSVTMGEVQQAPQGFYTATVGSEKWRDFQSVDVSFQHQVVTSF